jgi:hypothetical protein
MQGTSPEAVSAILAELLGYGSYQSNKQLPWWNLPPLVIGTAAKLEVQAPGRHCRVFRRRGEWARGLDLRLVKIGAEGEVQAQDVMEIDRPDELGDISDLGLTLSETKRLLAALQQEIVAVQVRQHAARRPICSRCGDACRVKDYREHVVATLFGQVTVRLPRFRCAACGGIEAGVNWPPYCRGFCRKYF